MCDVEVDGRQRRDDAEQHPRPDGQHLDAAAAAAAADETDDDDDVI